MPRDWRLTGNNSWEKANKIPAHDYDCGYCSAYVSSENGLITGGNAAQINICPQCNGPSFFSSENKQWPGPRPGGSVKALGKEIEDVYNEARDCLSVNAYTGTVMLCCKILMNVAVEKGAAEGLHFAGYVGWLLQEGYAPKGSEGWVTYIKDRGNEANHEIVPKGQDEAIGVLRFTEQLLRNMFELPSLVPPVIASQSETDSTEE